MAINSNVTVKELGINPATNTPITQINLNAVSTLPTGGNGAPNKIQYTMRSLDPDIGYFVRNTTPLQPVVFTQAEINSGVIRYVADPSNVTKEYIKVNLVIQDLNDPSSRPVNVTLTIRYNFPDRAPEGGTLPLYVGISENKVIGNVNIHFTDIKDPPSAIFMRVQAWPQFGDIYLKGKRIGPGTEFTQDDIDKGRLEYRHNGSREEELDYLVFKVRDAKNNWSGVVVGEPEDKAPVYTLEIRIRLVDKLIQIQGSPRKIKQCEELIFSQDSLWAVDEDDPDEPITFVLKKLPLHGILKKNNSPMKVGDTWVLADITAGRLSFTHDCSKTPFDEIIMDAYHTRETSTVTDFKYILELVPNEPPIVDTVILEVERCESGVFTEENIYIRDPEGLKPDKLEIEVTVLPTHGELLLDGNPVKIGDKFTYKDVLDSKLTYTHDCTVHTPWTDGFEFIVRDEMNEVRKGAGIVITNENNKPPYLTVNKPHSPPRNGEVNFDVEDVNFTDDDGPLEDAWLEITELPLYGTFYINGEPAFVGQKFNQPDWQLNTFRYVAEVTDRNVLNDYVHFVMYDEFSSHIAGAMLFIFPPPPLLCPEIVYNPITMSFTKEKAITELNLLAYNEGVDPSEFVFTVTKTPNFGYLKVDGKRIGRDETFTSNDILLMLLSYQHERDTPEEDVFELSVTNGFCAREIEFHVFFLPGLELKNEKLVVEQSETGTIDNSLLLATSGSVTTDAELVYTIRSLPKVGKLMLGTVEIEIGTKLTQEDINSGRLTYVPDPDQMVQSTDFFTFEVTDGIEKITDNFLIELIMTDRPPELVMNELVLGELTCKQITGSNIYINDRESTDDQLKLQILKLPLYGTLSLKDVPLKEGDVFTYQDIRFGFLSYCETEEGALLDVFDFSLTDAGGNVLPLETFPIRIIPPPPPELVNKGLVVPPCTKRAITGVSLNVLNLRTTFNREDMIFTITRGVSRGVLERNGVLLNEGDTFTLADIYANVITYTSITYRTDPDSFDFEVNSIPFSGSGTFDIKFTQVNNPPWICFQTQLVLFELETRAITYDYLQMCDVDMDYANVDDPNPDDAETPGETDNWEEGEVISPSDTDPVTNKASKTIFLKKPGSTMVLKFKVDIGYASIFVQDQNRTVHVNSGCRSNTAGELEYTFNTGLTSQYVNILVTENCAVGPTPAVWNVDFRTKEG